MTNFKPFKDYFFYLFDKLYKKYQFKGEFLDVGTGLGDFSLYLAKKGFKGDAIDISKEAVRNAKKNLKGYEVNVKLGNITNIRKKYDLVIMTDVIEHVEDDMAFFKEVSKRIKKKGYVLLTIPSYPREWGWDDEFYGHFRRYIHSSIKMILEKNGVKILVIWDTTFPFFWSLRRLSLKLLKKKTKKGNKLELTKSSTQDQYWKIGLLGGYINNSFFWRYLFPIQSRFKEKKFGHELMVLGVKND